MFRIGVLLTLASLLAAGCGPSLSTPGGATATPFIMTATLQPTHTAPVTAVGPTAASAATAAPIEGSTSTQVYVRQQPSSTGPPSGLIAALTKVEIQAKDPSGNWYQIFYTEGPGGKGWVAAQYVDVKDRGTIPVLAGPPDAGSSGVLTEQVNVRTGPGAGFDALGRLNANDVVTLTGRDPAGTWLQIQYPAGPDGKGWVAAEFVQANQLDELSVIAQSGNGLGTAAPTDISPTTTPTLAAASDHDSAEAPAADVTFSPLGAGSMMYSSDLSTPVGDGEDWIRFTPYGTTVFVSLTCTGNAAVETQLTQNGTGMEDSRMPACSSTMELTVATGLPYILKLFLKPAQGQPEYVRYVLRIGGAP